MRTSLFRRLMEKVPREAVLCGAPIAGGGAGGGGYTLPDLAAPTSGDVLLLGVSLSLFVTLGVWMFRRWGSAGSPARAAELSTPMASELAAPATPQEARGERELVGV